MLLLLVLLLVLELVLVLVLMVAVSRGIGLFESADSVVGCALQRHFCFSLGAFVRRSGTSVWRLAGISAAAMKAALGRRYARPAASHRCACPSCSFFCLFLFWSIRCGHVCTFLPCLEKQQASKQPTNQPTDRDIFANLVGNY